FRLYADGLTYSRHGPNDNGHVQDEFSIDLHACEIESLEMDGKDVICIRPCSQHAKHDGNDGSASNLRESIDSGLAEEVAATTATVAKSGRHARQAEPEIIYLQAGSDRQHAMLLVLLR